MARRRLRRPSGDRHRPVADALALLVFVTVGVLTHGSSRLDWVRDVVLFEAAWFALWKPPLVVRWLVAVTAAVGVRAAFVGHFSIAFYLVALAFTAVLVAAFRVGLARIS